MTALTNLSRALGAALFAVVLLTGCSKEELVAPTIQEDGVNKVRVITVPMDDTRQDAFKPGSTGEDTSISDDGDDVGDGERNRKKKPSN